MLMKVDLTEIRLILVLKKKRKEKKVTLKLISAMQYNSAACMVQVPRLA
jgi:hypothetical protein